MSAGKKYYGLSDEDINIKETFKTGKLIFSNVAKIFCHVDINEALEADTICICKKSIQDIIVFVEIVKDSAKPFIDEDGNFSVCFSLKSVSLPKSITRLNNYQKVDNLFYIPDEELRNLISFTIDFPTEAMKPSLENFAEQIAQVYGVDSRQVNITICNKLLLTTESKIER